MSASTELLLEQIKSTEEAIVAAETNKQPTSSLKQDLKSLRKKLHAANEALTEGKTLLKG
jgi:hypothetical protein